MRIFGISLILCFLNLPFGTANFSSGKYEIGIIIVISRKLVLLIGSDRTLPEYDRIDGILCPSWSYLRSPDLNP